MGGGRRTWERLDQPSEKAAGPLFSRYSIFTDTSCPAVSGAAVGAVKTAAGAPSATSFSYWSMISTPSTHTRAPSLTVTCTVYVSEKAGSR